VTSQLHINVVAVQRESKRQPISPIL